MRLNRTVWMTLAALAMVTVVAPAQPRIQVVEGKKFDFGTIYRGTVVDRKITIKNTGNENLELGAVDVSCGCTGTLLSTDRIAPGETGAVKITFNSKNFAGPVHKTVTVNSNAANDPKVVIEFTARIIDEVALSPQHYWFKDAEVGKKATMKVTLTNNGSEPLKLTGFRTQLAGLALVLPGSPLEPGKSVEIIAEFIPAKTNPLISDGVFLLTSNPRQAEVYIPVYGNAKEFKFE